MSPGAPGVLPATFDDVQRVLTLFAQAIADRPLHLEPADDAPPTGRDRAILTDRLTLRVPTQVDDAGSYRVSVLHQVGMVLFGTADADTSELSALGREVFLALEDVRIDAVVRRQYPGASADLDRVLAATAALDPALGPALEPGLDAVVRQFADVLEHPAATADDSVRIARAVQALAADDGGSDSDDDEFVTPIDASELDELSSPDEPGARFSIDAPDGPIDPGEEMIDGATLDVLGELRVDIEASQASHGLGQVHADLLGAAAAGPRNELDRDAAHAGPPHVPQVRPQPGTGDRVYLYDEWDHLHGAYLRAWCHLTEQRLRGDDMAFIGDVRRRHAVLASQVKRRFAFARSEGWHRVHRTNDGDELELDAVIESIVDRRAGHVMNDRLYVRRDRAAREVATAFLVDLSASTGSPIDEPTPPSEEPEPAPTVEPVEYRYMAFDEDLMVPEPPSRRVLDIAKESLALMCDALQVLGDRHAVYGFSGEGRDNVEFQIAKDFRDPVSMRSWAALAAMKPRRYTRMGPAIRHATAKIHREAVRTKLLIVLSDGYPQDIDYGPDRADKEYGLQDTARALREAEDLGIATFCMTIDPAGHDYLRRMCPESRYLVIDDVTALPGELVKVYRALTSFAPGRARHRRGE